MTSTDIFADLMKIVNGDNSFRRAPPIDLSRRTAKEVLDDIMWAVRASDTKLDTKLKRPAAPAAAPLSGPTNV